ncbi:MAG: T9SS type A sorting domain-containing protein, partial [Bacteroidota bacterium]
DVTGLTGPATYGVTVTDAANNTATASFFVRDEVVQNGGCPGTVIRLLFAMDQNDDQIYFQFNDGQGTPLFGQYPGVYTEPGGLISYTFCIPDGCYEIELSDFGQDGLCGPNSNPQGFFRLEDVTNNTDLINVCSIPNTIVTPLCFGSTSSLALTTTATPPTCFGGSDGTASVTATGGSGNYTYSWGNGGTTPSISNLTSGTYTIVVNDGADSRFGVVTVPLGNLLTGTTTSTNSAPNGATGTATVIPNGGVAPISYLWNNGGTTPTITGLTAGNYVCTLTDVNGCADTVTAIVQEDAFAQVPLERGRILVNGDGWQTVNFSGTYVSPVVIATPVTGDRTFDPVVARVRNVTGTGCELRVQRPGGATTDPYDIEYLVVEEGVYDQPTYGIQMEAVRTTSTRTAAKSRWGNAYRENRTYQQIYGNPVVLGQVMSTNDGDFSVFWASRNGTRNQAPAASGFAAGKHVAEDGDKTRANEELGYLVVEAGTGTLNGEVFLVGVGPDAVKGITNTTLGNLYSMPNNVFLTGGVLGTAGLDGGDGGWPVFRASPIGNGGIRLSVEEDQIGDSERSHTTEEVAYFLLGVDLGPSSLAPPTPPVVDAGTVPVATPSPETITLNAYPNPTSQFVNVRFTSETAIALTLTDLSGRQLRRLDYPATRGERTERIELGNVPAGVYLLRLTSDEAQVTKRLVVR